MQKKLFNDPVYSGVPLTPDNFLQIDVFTSMQNWNLNIEGLAYNIDGTIVPFQNNYRMTNIITVNTFTIRLGYYALISVVASTTDGAVMDGSTFVRISLVGGPAGAVFPFRKLLCQGYLSYYQSVGYGSNGNNDSGMDHLYSLALEPTPPAAGAPFIYTLPPWYHLTFQHIKINYASNATVASRYLFAQFEQQSGLLNSCFARIPLTASLTINVQFYPLGEESLTVGSNTLLINMPNIRLDYGGVLTISAINIQAGDEITAVHILAKNQVKPY